MLRLRKAARGGLACLCLFILSILSARGQVSNRVVQVGVNQDYPPYEFADSDHRAVGFDIDIVNAAANAVSLKVNFVSGEWSGLRKKVETGELDLLGGMLYSEERSKLVEFGAPYLSVEYSLFVRKGTKDLVNLRDVGDKAILVEEGSQMHDQLSKMMVGEILAVGSEPEALRRLNSGVGDAAMVPLFEGLTVAADEGLANVEPVGGPVYSRNLCFAAPKGKRQVIDRLNTGLAIIRKNGVYDEIYDKWFGKYQPSKGLAEQARRNMLWGLALAGGALLAAAAWVVTLRRQIQKQTAKLKSELAERTRIADELRVSETKYRMLLDQASDGIFIADEHLVVTDVNTAGCDLFGYDRDELIGRTVHSLHDPAELLTRPIDEDGLNRGEVMVRDRVYIRKDGERVFAEVHAKKVTSGMYIGILRDISHRKRAEDRLKQVNEELEDTVWDRTLELESAYNELESFSYSVAHDLRSPLRAMNGYAGIILQDYGEQVPAEAKQYLERIRANSHKMGELIDSLLSYARTSRVALEVKPLAMKDLVQEAWRDLAVERDGRKVELTVGDLPPAQGDPVLVKLLLANLLSNAIKFTRNSHPAKIEVGCDEAQHAYYVRDNGVGFDPQYKDKLFRVFERLHATDFQGTGVGLAIVKRVVERHGGKVWAEGELNQGATIWFSLNGGRKQPRNHNGVQAEA